MGLRRLSSFLPSNDCACLALPSGASSWGGRANENSAQVSHRLSARLFIKSTNISVWWVELRPTI